MLTKILINVYFESFSVQSYDRSFKVFFLLLVRSTFYVGLVLKLPKLLGFGRVVALMQNYSMPRVFFTVEPSVNEMDVGLVVRTVVNGSTLLPILASFLFARDQGNLCINEALFLYFNLSVIHVVHV